MTTNTFYYFYKIRYYNDEIERTATGIVTGETWAKTISNLADTYGELEMFAIDKLICINDGFACVEFDEINFNLKHEDFKIEVITDTKYPNYNITSFEKESEIE